MPPRVAIFGGSFDPVHRGHLLMARKAIEIASLDEVIFMPAAVSPFKRGTVASPEQRLHMLELAIDGEGSTGLTVSDFELNRPAPSYSWQTVRHFQSIRPGVGLFWILGTDQWEAIERWAEPEILRESLHFFVFTRHGDPVQERPGWNWTAIPFEHPASSTAIRTDFTAHRDWLTPSVADYCEAERIYP